jgi:hypothetical protein
MSERINPAETEQEKTDAKHRAELGGSICTIYSRDPGSTHREVSMDVDPLRPPDSLLAGV